MSRTYRFKKHRWLEADVLRELVRTAPYRWAYQRIDAHSKEGRKKLAEFHSDKKDHWMNYRGPSWFHREFSQKPYKVRARRELHRYQRDPDHEVMIESKPRREYWL